jgi:3'-phosphoadenosine 5'-phosphosulfate sulfotransferase (PAPS reductase)/FAD synthetase
MKLHIYGSDFKAEIQKALDEHGISAILMGNRRTDPWSDNLKYIDQSSPGWPVFTRVFPILDWTYKDVWAFLQETD